MSKHLASSGAHSRRAIIGAAGAAMTALILPVRARAQGPEAAAPGRRNAVVEIEARETTARLRGDKEPPTSVWTYEGAGAPPVLRVLRGEEVALRLRNGLPEPTLVHWRGLRVSDAVDGVPFLTQQPVPPGGAAELRFAPPDAGTFPFGPNPVFAGQLGRGLSGVLIVDESAPVGIDADVALLLEDWRLKPDGALVPPNAAETGAADHITANKRSFLDIPVRAGQRLRLRLVNASPARFFTLRLEHHRSFVVAIDGQPSEPFAPREGRIALAPGNRIDLFVDASAAPGSTAALTLESAGGPVPVARLVYGPQAAPRAEPLPPPKALPANALPERMDFAQALRVAVPIGGPASPKLPATTDPTALRTLAPAFTAKRGRAVVLTLANGTPAAQVFELHNQPFRLLDKLDDGWKPFWLDTLALQPGQTVRIAFAPEMAGKRMVHVRPIGQTQGTAFFRYDVV